MIPLIPACSFYQNPSTFLLLGTLRANLERTQLLLELFIKTTSEEMGIRERVSLVIVNQSDICECDTHSRVIYISQEKIRNYGSQRSETFFNYILDLLPNHPERLTQTLCELSRRDLSTLKTIFTPELSDIEVEAMIRHEIGHIAWSRIYSPCMLIAEKHLSEFAADLYAYLTPRGRVGLSRGFKRTKVQLFLLSGQMLFKRLARMQSKKVHPTHPWPDQRLFYLATYEAYLLPQLQILSRI